MIPTMDIICFSHLRWDFVFQRPQHLMTRFAKTNRVFFIEEPVFDSTSDHNLIQQDPVTGIWVITPYLMSQFKSDGILKSLLDQLMQTMEIKDYLCWYYSPMALKFSQHLIPKLMIYDCMDELSAFRFAPAELKQFEAILFSKADLVFTGGHHLFEAKQYLHNNIHPFPSSIDKEHFKKARSSSFEPADQSGIPFPRIGFYGVIDERFNMSLLKELAARNNDWQFILLGPVVKIDPSTLPRMDNIHFPGGKKYEELPLYLAGWDIAMMPFALNESTKYISPTKTPEFLAGGKQVVSTSIRDVIKPYGDLGLVEIADTVNEFEEAIERLLNRRDDEKKDWLAKTDQFLSGISWDKTFEQMVHHIQESITRNKNIDNNKNKMEAYV
jgi:glycosyltransferase involved in cell wall biosynthesis